MSRLRSWMVAALGIAASAGVLFLGIRGIGNEITKAIEEDASKESIEVTMDPDGSEVHRSEGPIVSTMTITPEMARAIETVVIRGTSDVVLSGAPSDGEQVLNLSDYEFSLNSETGELFADLSQIFGSKPQLRIVGLESLQTLEVDGIGVVRIENMDIDDLRVDIQGTGRVEVAGTTIDALDLDIEGLAAFVMDSDSRVRETDLNGDGLGIDVDLRLSETDAVIRGSFEGVGNSLDYWGDPQVNEFRSSGLGNSIEDRD